MAPGKPGLGTFVDGTLGSLPLDGFEALRRGVLAWIAEARRAGLDDDDIVALFSSALTAVRDADESVAVS